MNAQEILEQLTELYAQQDLLKIAKDDARDAAIPDEVEAALADIDVEFTPKLESIAEKIAALEAQAKVQGIYRGLVEDLRQLGDSTKEGAVAQQLLAAGIDIANDAMAQQALALARASASSGSE